MSRHASWQLLYSGSADEFIDALCREALEHRAVHHPYLQRLASGDLPDMAWAVRDYAYQYGFYGREFISYLEGVIGSLEKDAHRELIYHNLEEEKGDPNSNELAKIPHTRLFQMFREAAGVNEAFDKEHRPAPTVLVWRDLFLQKCQSRQPGVALGGMGIGTEFVVPTIYGYINEGLKLHSSLSDDDRFFFELHAKCDEEHADHLIQIAKDLAADRSNKREAIRFGAISALNLRAAVWDVMLARAITAKDEQAL
ncbi:MAG: iron-containing redox enzyme family protein [Myxococcales bacterium]|nr:MAG: iron-containing redox enzyme family protein [Myxococcales bacterium]